MFPHYSSVQLIYSSKTSGRDHVWMQLRGKNHASVHVRDCERKIAVFEEHARRPVLIVHRRTLRIMESVSDVQ